MTSTERGQFTRTYRATLTPPARRLHQWVLSVFATTGHPQPGPSCTAPGETTPPATPIRQPSSPS
jgi:hypothetical protein